MIIMLSVQSVQHIVDLLESDLARSNSKDYNSESGKMIKFLEEKINEKSSYCSDP